MTTPNLGDTLRPIIQRIVGNVIKEAQPDMISGRFTLERLHQNATDLLVGRVIRGLRDYERQVRLDEHKVLAGLDEAGRKKRYFDLADE